jgi:hypothetical protein
VVEFTTGSRGKVPGKACEKIAMMTIIIMRKSTKKSL